MTKTLLKGLLGASALTALSTGTAFAAGTTAGTTVSNTFTLTYDVGTTAQPAVTGAAPTTFVVDRLIDVQVTANTPINVAPSAQDQVLNYTVVNEGNDVQAYVLTAANEVPTGSDDFEASNFAIFYVIDANGNGLNDDGAPVAYNGTSTPDIAADQIVFVTVEGDIPAGVAQDETSNVTLLAETAVTGGSGTLVTEDTDGNDIDAAENVFADALGDVSGDAANSGSHSDTNTYTVSTAEVTAEKLVSVYAQVPSGTNDCAAIPGVPATPAADQYAVPGSCVEYTITATNAGAETATNIDIADTLPTDLTFIAASASGFSTAGTFVTLPSSGQDCAATPCVLSYEAAELTDGSTTPTVGVVTIRALVK